jgi:putative two-component system response regulator
MESGASVLVVDDNPQVRGMIRSLVEGRGDRCLVAGDIAAARRALADHDVDLVLCDIELGGESGLDLIRWLQLKHPAVAAIMITALDDSQLADAALGFGAYGYITKPFRTNDVLRAIQNALRRRSLELASEEQREQLEDAVAERTVALAATVGRLTNAQEGLRASQEETIRHLALAAELRDEETGHHIARVGRSAGLLAERLGLTPERSEFLRLASQLHDIGKIGIADEILRKRGPLSPAERLVMEQHPEIGHRILSESRSPLLHTAATIALSHHECWDGSGYPFGLVGERIPVEGRLVAVVDVYDALTHARPYRRAFLAHEAVATMRVGHGAQFDPGVLAVFLDTLEDVRGQREIGTDKPHRPSGSEELLDRALTRELRFSIDKSLEEA